MYWGTAFRITIRLRYPFIYTESLHLVDRVLVYRSFVVSGNYWGPSD